MANRVVVGAFAGTYVLRVSRPGFDVLNGGLTPEQLVFDSRWSEAGNVFLRGSVVRANAGDATQIMFGETFSQPPAIFVYRSTDVPNVWEPWAASFVQPNETSPVYLRTDSFYLRHEDGGTRTFVYACCRNLYSG